MPRKLSASAVDTLITAFLLLSLASAVAILAARNLYDDELLSLPIITRSTQYMVHFSSHWDVHPPGMYLLAHFSWLVLPSYRWMNLAPTLVLYAGIAIFVRAVTPLLAGLPARMCFLLLATLHPQLLLWGTSFRWYSWWTGTALICLTVALQPPRRIAAFTTARAIAIALLLAVLFYLNYITILFAIALAAAMVVRYRDELGSMLLRYAMSIGICCMFVAPQMYVFLTVHLQRGREQSSGLIISFARLMQALGESEAYLPWHPLAIISIALIAWCCVRAFRAHFRTSGGTQQIVLASLAAFGAVFFVLVVATGLGGKPRSALLLVPVLAVIVASGMEEGNRRYTTAAVSMLALWCAVGMMHMLGRYGLSKAEMIDRPEQVVAFLRGNSAPPCAVVATYDPALSFATAQANLPGVRLIAPFPWPVGEEQPPVGPACPNPSFYAVKSYLGNAPQIQASLDSELDGALRSVRTTPQIHQFSRDPNAPMKRKLARFPAFGSDLNTAAHLPDYRYVVISGPVDPASFAALQRALKDFTNKEE